MKRTPLKPWHIAFFIVFLLSFVGLRLWQLHVPTETLVLKDVPLTVLVARTPAAHYKGLSGREALSPYDGMLFIFPIADTYGFVMRDMLFPIDIVWLHNGEVVDIAPSLPPENVPEQELTRYYPRKPANTVLELPAGWAAQHGLKIGDRLGVPQDA